MRKLYFLLSALLLSAFSLRAQTNINVVFHVVYKTAAQNIADSCLQHQLDVLNEDFNATNADLWKVPSAWTSIIGSMNVNFVLATQDPSGNPTTGIERRNTTVTSFNTNNAVCYYNQGGLDAWPDTSYLNIWVCNLGNSLMSYAQFPGGPAATDGVVIHYQACGRGSYCLAPYNLGRAGTHAVGHWFGLKNMAPQMTCSTDDDGIADTPPYVNPMVVGGYAPSQVVTDSCNPSAPGIMWMNFMTYVNDSSMYFFTQGQTDTMTWYMNNMRLGNTPTGIQQQQQHATSISIYPSPSPIGFFTLERSDAETQSDVIIYNVLGDVVTTFTIGANEKTRTINLSAYDDGVYAITVTTGKERISRRVIIAR